MGQQKHTFFSFPPVAVIVTLGSYLLLNAGCALLMPIFPLLGLIGAITINLVALLFWRVRFALPLYVLVASPSIALSLSSGILSRLYIGNMLFALIVFIWLLRVVLPQRKSGQILLDRSLLVPLLCLMLAGLSSIIYARIFPDPNVPYQYPHSTV